MRCVSLFVRSRLYTAATVPSAFPGIGRLNHIAIATRTVQEHLAFFGTALGARISERCAQPEHGVYTTFVELPNVKIELLEELGKTSPIRAFLDKNPRGGIHHVCYEVGNLLEAIEHLRRVAGIEPIDAQPRIGAHGNPVVFLHPRDCNGILTELEEVKPK